MSSPRSFLPGAGPGFHSPWPRWKKTPEKSKEIFIFPPHWNPEKWLSVEKQIFFFAPRILTKKAFTGSELEDRRGMARGFPVCVVGYSVSDLTFVVRFLTGYRGLAEGGGRLQRRPGGGVAGFHRGRWREKLGWAAWRRAAGRADADALSPQQLQEVLLSARIA